MTSGLPSGLRVTDWKSAPETPSAAPTPMATVRRGPRSRLKTNRSLPSASPTSAAGRSARSMPRRPQASVVTAAARRRTKSPAPANTEARRMGIATVRPTTR